MCRWASKLALLVSDEMKSQWLLVCLGVGLLTGSEQGSQSTAIKDNNSVALEIGMIEGSTLAEEEKSKHTSCERVAVYAPFRSPDGGACNEGACGRDRNLPLFYAKNLLFTSKRPASGDVPLSRGYKGD